MAFQNKTGRKSAKVELKGNGQLAFACEVASRLVVKPSLKLALLEAAKKLRSLDAPPSGGEVVHVR